MAVVAGVLTIVLIGSAPAGILARPSATSSTPGHVRALAGTPSPLRPQASRSGDRTGAGPALSWWNITGESTVAPPVDWFTEATWDATDGYLVSYGGDNFVSTNLNATQTFVAGNWSTPATGGTSPGPLDGPALAYDPLTGHVVMYGGYSDYAPFTYTNRTYTYSAGTWSGAQLNPTPPAPTAAAMAFDADLGGTVLFGGYNNSDSTGQHLLNDLWLSKGGIWSALPDTNPPPVRTWPSLAYDPGRHELVMYGGVTASFACLGDTWTYNGTWSRISSSGGPGGLY
ncbi:MAG: hypothetical protein ACHQ16_05510, partial [Candidatus Lutacidiplasmatales archaeon]